MRKYQRDTSSGLDPVTKMAMSLAEVLGERSHLNKDLLIALSTAVGRNEETHRRFRDVVLVRLSRIEAMLTEIQGAQLADYWPPDRVTDEKRDEYVREVGERVSKTSKEIGLKMLRYIYGESGEPGVRRGTKRKRSDGDR